MRLWGTLELFVLKRIGMEKPYIKAKIHSFFNSWEPDFKAWFINIH